ncbi:hypothetical protein GZ77_09070 [Endozoicomonas montiporae]|uniref:Lysozyme n=3 Tax=Endozoicomonas montiporae TaxID=1027273 RepID=A0A081N7S2_9GAMM|nr:hypothetical protein [Endozoicomonas montiporae]AMO55644.1 lysozyme_like protein [Endozoicomonas montiporae CL-33]KEQ14495.1 hypothetical protein GZ77_09070 [Endozoicomonas montiporae]
MKAEDLIRHHEGFRSRPYRCTAGKLTIGYGRNIEDNGITRDEAEQLLANDVYDCRQVLIRNLLFWDQLDRVRQTVLVDMCFNLGWPKFSQFRKMINALALRDFSLAAKEMLESRWAKQVPNRAGRLIKMMATGEWPEDIGRD